MEERPSDVAGQCCCEPATAPHEDPRYRRVLWVALALNALMFGVELVAGLAAGSVSLLADSIDFLGDAANYGVSLLVLGMGAGVRARTAMFKAACMAAFGVWVLASAGWQAVAGGVPEATTMGAVGLLALLVNLGVAAMLFRWRAGDANMRSVWLCSRNDALGNLAVLGAALGVAGTGTAWPDLLVAAVMAVLALGAARHVLATARGELRALAAGSAG